MLAWRHPALAWRHRVLALAAGLLLTLNAAAQDPPSLVLQPRVVPPPVAEAQTSCAECQPLADAHNWIAGRINDLNFQLAHRRREVDLQRQAIALVEAEIAALQSAAPSQSRDARLATARQRLEAYQAQLKSELAKAAELEKQIAEATAALAAAKAQLQACEAACVAAGSAASTQTPQVGTGNAGAAGSTGATSSTGTPSSATGSTYRWRSDAQMQRDYIEQEKLDATLKAMTGDQWGAELAAFFTSTLFDTDTPFDTAYVQNLRTLQRVNEPTPEQITAAAELERQNARVAAQQATKRAAALDAQGQTLIYNYTQDARGLIGPGYANLATAGESHKIAALMTQDAHIGQLLQFRAALNTVKIGDGTVLAGSFVNMSGAESFTRLSQINQEIGTLRANDGDEDRIAALETERAQLLAIPGLAQSDGLMAARTGLITGLTSLSANVYDAYWYWIYMQDYGILDRKYWNLTPDQREAVLAQYENAYLTALGQSPFLGAMADPTGSGDSVPLWKYLTSTLAPWAGKRPWYPSVIEYDTRLPATDQVALTQAIDFIDAASVQVIDQFGTIVTTTPLLEAYGSPVFAPLRVQIVEQLSPMYPGISANMQLLSSQYDANFAATALSRTATDVAIGFVQIVVGGVIFFFPITAPVLVPVEIALTAGQVGLEGFRTYYAWQDLQTAEQAASVGAGASYVGANTYQDLFRAQVFTFVLVAGTAPIVVSGSIMSLEVANAQRAAAVARSEARAAAATADTAAGTVAGTTGAVAGVAPDFATFRAMHPNDQVAAVRGLPESTRGKLVSQLDPAEQKVFAFAWERAIGNGRIIASVRQGGDMWLEQINGNFGPLSQATRNASDAEIQALLDSERIILSRAGRQRLYEEGFGADEIGPFSTVPPRSSGEGAGEGTFPEPGYYTSQMTQAEIDALLAKTSPLTPEEIALKADLLLRGYGLTPDVVPGWTAPVDTPVNAFNPFAEFGPGGAIDPNAGTVGGAADSGLSGGTEVIPNRPRNPNRTALLDEPDLPPDTIIFRPFTPPAAGLLDLPFDIGRLLQGDPLPINIWHTGEPAALRTRGPMAFEPTPTPTPTSLGDSTLSGDTTVVGAPLGTIVHVTPPTAPTRAATTTPPWVPFVIKMFPIGCRYIDGESTKCDEPTYTFVAQYPVHEATTVAEALRSTPGFVFAEGDVLRRVQAVDPYLTSRGSWGQSYDDQWALKQIGLGAASDAGAARDIAMASGSGAATTPVTVAVIDTGVAWNHKDLTSGDLWVNAREIPANHKDDDGNGYVDDIVGWNFVDGNNLPWDFNGHGTLVAGIIAAGRDNGIGIAGVNPAARIMVLKAMDERGRGRASTIAEAIVYAAKHGARVINLSVGGPRLTRTEQLAIEYAWSQGVVVVVAAGNDGIDLADYGPGGLRRALTVTATDPVDRRIANSNFGGAIDLAAPGVDVLGPRALGTDLPAAMQVKGYRPGSNIVGPDAGYMRATGTSFAAPLVAGVASLLIAANPSLSAQEVERLLLQSARDIEAPGTDPLTGYGRLDAAAALAADPAFHVDTRIARAGAATVDGVQMLEVFGTADADRLRSARLEYAAGENPSAWKRAGNELRSGVRDALLGRIPASELRGAPVWTLRVVAVHANGRERESRYRLTLK
ncbi:MAG: S8 family serine peptidase [Gammaproteobacteria bacterium]